MTRADLQNKKASSFCFVLDRIDVESETPIEVIPGHFLQKANVDQVLEIKQKLEAYHTFWPVPVTRIYEIDSETQQSLPPEQWRYSIIAFDGPNHEVGDLETAASLLLSSLQ